MSANSWPAKTSAWSKAFEKLFNRVFKSYCPLEVLGRQYLPAVPYIIGANHTSHLDSVILMEACGLAYNDTGLIAAKDYFFDKSHRFFLHYLMNLIPIARGSGPGAIKGSIEACRSFLDAGGKVLIIYPEGTRARTSKIGSFKQGASILASELDLPIVPAFVSGSLDSMPKGAYFLRPRKLKVSFAPSLKVSDWLLGGEKYDRKAIFKAYRESSAELERRVLAMAEVEQKIDV